MESIYDPKCFRSSEKFNTKEHFEKYRDACPFYHTGETKEKFSIITDMGVPDYNFDFNKVEESCSIDLLKLPQEADYAIQEVPHPVTSRTKLHVAYPVTEEAKTLNVIRCKEIVEGRTNIQMICNKRFLKPTVAQNTDTSFNTDILPGANFIYSIYVYKPFSISYGQRNAGEKMRFAMEIEALGTNTLAEFADTIECASNLGIVREVENTKVDTKLLRDAKKHYPSQTIFIDGVFYNDFRSPDAIDYSKVSIEWAKNHNIGKFTTAEMDKVLLESLTPRFGYPYVYIHHGNCEHIFAFADARLTQPGDLLVSKKYPRIYTITRSLKPLCFLCSISHSHWVVKDCRRFPHEKVFLCTSCCDSYLYLDGEKIGEFKLYPFYDIVGRYG